MKKLLVLALVMSMVSGCMACGASKTETASESEAAVEAEETGTAEVAETSSDSGVVIGYAVNNYTNPYYFGIIDGGDIAAEEL